MGQRYTELENNAPSVRGKHFKILQAQFFGLISIISLGMVHWSLKYFANITVISDQMFAIVFALIIISLVFFIIRKLHHLKMRTKVLVHYVDQLLKNESRFRALFESSQEGHLLYSPQSGVLDYNSSLIKLLALKETDLADFKLSTYILSPFKHDKNFEDFESSTLEENCSNELWLMKTTTGIELPVRIKLNKVFIFNEFCFLATLQNETTTILRHEQLKEITEKAVMATKAKSQFIANMSHELRTPLNAIIGITDDLYLEETEINKKNDIKIVNESGKNLLVLINNVLDYSKLEAEKMELESLPMDLNELCLDLEKTFTNIALKKNILLKIHISAECPRSILGDKVRLRQVLYNLIGNAIKFTTYGHVELAITGIADGDKALLKFEIKDTGTGIKEEHISKLFTSFEQVDNTMTRRFGGTGLGLAISQNIVSLMSSDIIVESVFGKGSIFRFQIETTVSKEIPKSEITHTLNSLPPFILQKKILIAEDNKVNQLVAKKMFKRLGFEDISMVENGLEALNKVKEINYDYIFMDMQMPVMDGVTACEKIHETIHFLDLPKIIAMTANNSVDDRRICTQAGMLGFISKPISLNDIVEIFIALENIDEKQSA